MASTPDTRNIGVELQAAGENLNTWGDPKLNNALKVLSALCSKFNTIQMTGDYTVSETNYSTTNDTEVALIKVTPNGIVAAANFVLPGRQKRLLFWNTTGYTVTVKLAASTGIPVPNNRVVLIATDGATDVYNASPNYLGTSFTPTLSGDYTNKLYVDTTVAAAAIPGATGTVKVDTGSTAGYLGVVLTYSAGISFTQVGSTLNAALDVNALTASSSIDASADYALVYSTSLGAHRKALPQDLANQGQDALYASIFAL